MEKCTVIKKFTVVTAEMNGVHEEAKKAENDMKAFFKALMMVNDFTEIEYRKNFETYTFDFKGLRYRITVQLLQDQHGDVINNFIIKISLPAGGAIYKKKQFKASCWIY